MKITGIEDIGNTIDKIWNSDYMNALAKELPWIKSRGYVFAHPYKADLLITGINPSFRKGDEERNDPKGHGDARVNFRPETWKERNGRFWDTYFGPMRRMLVDVDNGINLMNRFDYLDIFNFKEKNQEVLRKQIMNKPEGVEFAKNELYLTQHIIEDIIKPKLILVKNKESWAYWGKLRDKNLIWMGYDFEKIRDYQCGELFKIVGLLDSKDRVAQDITNENTSLKGTFVLFTEHITQYTKKEKRPTAVLLNDILKEHR